MGVVSAALALVGALFPTAPPESSPPAPQSYLAFSLCNGLGNQHLSLLAGIALAREHALGIILPSFVSDGRQNLTASLEPVFGLDALLPFDSVFDAPRFIFSLSSLGMPTISSSEADALGDGSRFPLSRDATTDEWSSFASSGARIAQLGGCALGAASPALLERHRALLENTLAALAPAPALAAHVAAVRDALGGVNGYDAVHLRYERDWAPLCAYWARTPLSPDVRNCGLLPPPELLQRLTLSDIGGGGVRPLFIAVDEASLDDPSLLVTLRSHFHRALTRRDVVGVPANLPRELGALVDFHVSLGSTVWAGNSYSTFSALLILIRQLSARNSQAAPEEGRIMTRALRNEKFIAQTPRLNVTTWYNGDAAGIPLEHELPLFRTVWTFVLPASLPRGGEDAVRVAVWTALRTAHLTPHVLVVGSATPLTSWMESMGVYVTFYDKGNASGVSSSSLPRAVSSPDLLAAIELPALPSLAGTQHALFTRYDVVWLRAVHAFQLASLTTSPNEPGVLPACVSVPPSSALAEAALSFDDVLLVNLECFRKHRSVIEAAAALAGSQGQEASTATHVAVRAALAGSITLLPPAWSSALDLRRSSFIHYGVRACGGWGSSARSLRTNKNGTEDGGSEFIAAARDMHTSGRVPRGAWESGCFAQEALAGWGQQASSARVLQAPGYMFNITFDDTVSTALPFQSTLSSSFNAMCAVADSGILACWGKVTRPQIGGYHLNGVGPLGGVVQEISQFMPAITSPVKSVSVGSYGGCFLYTASTAPTCFSGGWFPFSIPSGYTTFSHGGDPFACGLDASRLVACWGYPQGGTPPSSPQESVTSNYYSACSLSASGTPTCWGGRDSEHIIPNEASSGVRSIFSNIQLSCALLRNKNVLCWSGSVCPGMPTPPSNVQGTTVSLGVGYCRACAVSTTGGLTCWGSSADDDIVPAFLQNDVVAVTLGTGFACAIRYSTQGIYCWTNSKLTQIQPTDIESVPLSFAAGAFTQSICAHTVSTGGPSPCTENGSAPSYASSYAPSTASSYAPSFAPSAAPSHAPGSTTGSGTTGSTTGSDTTGDDDNTAADDDDGTMGSTTGSGMAPSYAPSTAPSYAPSTAPSSAPSTSGIIVIAATYGASCGVPANNIRAAVASACNGLATCSFPVCMSSFTSLACLAAPVFFTDPAPGCYKDISVSWACGAGFVAVGSPLYIPSYPSADGSVLQLLCTAVSPPSVLSLTSASPNSALSAGSYLAPPGGCYVTAHITGGGGGGGLAAPGGDAASFPVTFWNDGVRAFTVSTIATGGAGSAFAGGGGGATAIYQGTTLIAVAAGGGGGNAYNGGPSAGGRGGAPGSNGGTALPGQGCTGGVGGSQISGGGPGTGDSGEAYTATGGIGFSYDLLTGGSGGNGGISKSPLTYSNGGNGWAMGGWGGTSAIDGDGGGGGGGLYGGGGGSSGRSSGWGSGGGGGSSYINASFPASLEGVVSYVGGGAISSSGATGGAVFVSCSTIAPPIAPSPSPPPAPCIVTTLAGGGTSGSLSGFLDGTGTAAGFNNPQGICLDLFGNVLIAEPDNHKIRRITLSGSVSTFVGGGASGSSGGSSNGQGTAALFSHPQGVAINSRGTVFVADSGNNLIRTCTPSGMVSTLASGFNFPIGISVDSNDNVFVADPNSNTIRRVSPSGSVDVIAGTYMRGYSDGQALSASFSVPLGVAVDATSSNVIVADYLNGNVRRLLPSSNGGYTTATVAIGFNLPWGVTVDNVGNIFVGETSANRLNRISLNGEVSVLAGGGASGMQSGSIDGAGTNALFSSVLGVAVNVSSGTLYVCDGNNNKIRKVECAPSLPMTPPSGESTPCVAGYYCNSTGLPVICPMGAYCEGGAAPAKPCPPGVYGNVTKLSSASCSGSCTAQPGYACAGGAVTVAGYPCKVGSYCPGGASLPVQCEPPYACGSKGLDAQPSAAITTVSTLAGSGNWGFADGAAYVAQFKAPSGVAVGANGVALVADGYNYRIRAISVDGTVSTLAGSGDWGYADGAASVAQFKEPAGIAVAASGVVLVADPYNHRIRAISVDGTVSTLAGSGSYGYTDGVASVALFAHPIGVAVSASGVLLVVEYNYHRIRAISVDGTVSTLAGSGDAGYADGAASVALFGRPHGLTVGANGVVYIADTDNRRIRTISVDGTVSTLAGSGIEGFADGAASVAQFINPVSVAVDVSGVVIVTDHNNNRVRMITPALSCNSMTSRCPHMQLLGYVDVVSGDSIVSFSLPLNLHRNALSVGMSVTFGGDNANHAGIITDTGAFMSTLTVRAAPGGTFVPGSSFRLVFSPAGAASPPLYSPCIFADASYLPQGGQDAFVSSALAAMLGVGAASVTAWGVTPATATYVISLTGIDVTGSNLLSVDAANNLASGTVCSAGLALDSAALARPPASPFAASSPLGSPSDLSPGLPSAFRLASPYAGSTAQRVPLYANVHHPVCPAGSYCPLGSGDVVPCPAGVYGSTTGLTTPACTGPCYAIPGSACTSGATLATGVLCPPGHFCTGGTALPLPCSAAPGFGCAGGDVLPAGTLCVIGTYCQGCALPPVACLTCTKVGMLMPPPTWNVTTLAGSGDWGHVDGAASVAQFNYPIGIAVSASGVVLVADHGNNLIRAISVDGIVSTLAGSGYGGYADGAASVAQFYSPWGIAVSASGVVLVADQGNNRIRAISVDGTVSTLAGSGDGGYADGAASVAQFNIPAGVAVGASGVLFVADFANHRIRAISVDGTVSTLAGSGDGGYADGAASVAQFAIPIGIAVSVSGVVYVTDLGNCIRAVSVDGTVSTLAGSGDGGYADGAASVAQFSFLTGVAVSASGEVYVTDMDNHRIRAVSVDGIVSTLAGSGSAGYSDGAASVAQFDRPVGIAVGASGVVLVADLGNHRIRVIAPPDTHPPMLPLVCNSSSDSSVPNGTRLPAANRTRGLGPASPSIALTWAVDLSTTCTLSPAFAPALDPRAMGVGGGGSLVVVSAGVALVAGCGAVNATSGAFLPLLLSPSLSQSPSVALSSRGGVLTSVFSGDPLASSSPCAGCPVTPPALTWMGVALSPTLSSPSATIPTGGSFSLIPLPPHAGAAALVVLTDASPLTIATITSATPPTLTTLGTLAPLALLYDRVTPSFAPSTTGGTSLVPCASAWETAALIAASPVGTTLAILLRSTLGHTATSPRMWWCGLTQVVEAIDTFTGASLWQYPLDSSAWGAPRADAAVRPALLVQLSAPLVTHARGIITSDGSLLLLALGAMGVRALNASTGVLVWERPFSARWTLALPAPPEADLVLALCPTSPAVLLVSSPQRLRVLALDVQSGVTLWDTPVGDGITAAAGGGAPLGGITSLLCDAAGWGYALAAGAVFGVSPTGAPAWAIPTGPPLSPWSGLALSDDGSLLALGGDDRLYAIAAVRTPTTDNATCAAAVGATAAAWATARVLPADNPANPLGVDAVIVPPATCSASWGSSAPAACGADGAGLGVVYVGGAPAVLLGSLADVGAQEGPPCAGNASTALPSPLSSATASASATASPMPSATPAVSLRHTSYAALQSSSSPGAEEGVNGECGTVTTFEGGLYAAGAFTALRNGTIVNYVAAWDGMQWAPLTVAPSYVGLGVCVDSGSGNACDSTFVSSLIVWNNALIVAGAFSTTADGTPVGGIVAWSGTAWSPLSDTGVGVRGFALSSTSFPSALAVCAGNLYVAGSFAEFATPTGTPSGSLVAGIAVWTAGGTWRSLPLGTSNGVSGGAVLALASVGSTLFLGGSFSHLADGTIVNGVASLSGTTGGWSTLGAGFESGTSVFALAIVGTTLYAGGDFEVLGDGATVVNGIASWSGSVWAPLVSFEYNGVGAVQTIFTGGDDVVTALASYDSGTRLYVGGEFTTVRNGTLVVNHLTTWDPAKAAWASLTNDSATVVVGAGQTYTWQDLSVGSSVGVRTSDIAYTVRAISSAPFQGRMYVCGSFDSLGDGITPAHSVLAYVDVAALVAGDAMPPPLVAGQRYG